MTGIIISIIPILGGADAPTGDFNTATAIDQPVATSESSTSVQRKK